MNVMLRERIVEALHEHGRRATYSALAAVVGGMDQTVMADLPRDWRNSWVVNKATGLPTDYLDDQIDPRFNASMRRFATLELRRELEAWLQSVGVMLNG